MSMRDCMSAQMYASPSAMYVFHYFFLFAKVYMSVMSLYVYACFYVRIKVYTYVYVYVPTCIRVN